MAKIVIVDDDPSMRLMISQSLELLGHEVWTADSGIRGVCLAHSVTPDVFITDERMHGLSGTETIAQLRETGFYKPAILITAGAREDLDGRLGRTTHFLAKPFSPPKLGAFVADVITGTLN